MARCIGTGILFCFALTLYGWQQASSGPVRPSFAGVWQLDPSKSQTEMKDLLWKIDQKEAEISIEETSAGKAFSLAKCPIGKSCEFEDSGKKMGAMTYFLDTALVQTRSTADNSNVVKRKFTLTGDGTLRVEMTTIVPSDKTEVLVFNKQAAAAAAKTPK